MISRPLGVAAIIGASLLWATTGTAAAQAPALNAIAVGAGAMGFGGLLQLLIHLFPLIDARQRLRQHAGMVTGGALCVAVYPLAFYGSMRLAGVAVGCMVSIASAPLAAAAIERVVLGRRLTRATRWACALGIVGAVLISLAGQGDSTDFNSVELATGVGLGIVAGATYAGYTLVMRTLMIGGISRRAVSGAVLGGGGLILLPVFWVAAPAHWDAESVGVITYLAVLPMFVGYLLFAYGLARVDATTATTVTLLEPAAATVLAVLVLGERISPIGWIGMAAIAGCLLILIAPQLTRRTP